MIFKLLSLLPKKSNTIIFESFHGKQYSDNPRAIYEYIINNDLGYKVYWSVDRRYEHVFEGRGVLYLKRFSLKWFILMARAEYWVVNTRLPLWLPKPNHTKYVQTWHGTPLKRLAMDMEDVHMPNTNIEKYKRNFLKESSKWDYLLSPNQYSTNIFKRAFGFHGEVVETGYPRNDFLTNSNELNTINEIKSKCGVPNDKKVILYAPTWRDNQYYSVGRYKFKLELDLKQMEQELGDDYVIILRLHYLIAEQMDLSEYNQFIINLSNHEDIRELYLISDMLITDYSSVFFDYAILKRPIIFFTYDLEEYQDVLRGFYLDLEEDAPGPVVRTTEQVIQEIIELSHNPAKTDHYLSDFHHRFCYLEDGNASKRVIESVLNNEK